ncbi:hypothetical protein AUR64_01285 [Haloprofundus marisrubri]|uniref:Uncharacterized protein n=1 Tax=Haloprofundus marisrubri TaxID=1514971 RepID=A0A0W1R3H3_9EURY|nr:hypothetical protein [Haloprofundus marisrubri]KTG07897.1 hypothetical protein AUR64_01285 [Haloprofundus marisrubri]
MTDDSGSSTSRRRTLLGIGALVLGGLGGGIGAQQLLGDPTGDSGSGFDLGVETRDGGRTPTPTGADSGSSASEDAEDDDADADGVDDGGSDDVEDVSDGNADNSGGDGPTDASADDDSRDSRGSGDDRDGEDSSGNGGGDGETTDKAHVSLRRVSSEPVRVGNLLPGHSGTASFVVELRGTDATLTVDGELYDTAENGRTEPERSDGDDTDDVGELQEFLHVTLWHDESGKDERGPRDHVVYDGPLSGLSRVENVALAGGRCVEPGTHHLGVEWTLPNTVGNVVQSDSVSFGVTVAAETCADRLLRR